MTSTLRSLLMVVSLALGLMQVAAGDVPKTLTYQGILTDGAGNPSIGEQTITLSLYTSETGGTAFWTETQTVTLVAGRLSVVLGAKPGNALETSKFTGLTYIGVKVGSDAEMLRQKFSSVAYAFQAGDGGVPTGGIIMWSGIATTIPAGWALCNGLNGTPDLRNRFVVGAGSSYAVAATGGEETHTLSISELPSHNHVVDPPYTETSTNGAHNHYVSARDAGSDGNYIGEDAGKGGWHNNDTSTNGDHRHGVDIPGFASIATGDGAAHENRPPYYAIAFIMKL